MPPPGYELDPKNTWHSCHLKTYSFFNTQSVTDLLSEAFCDYHFSPSQKLTEQASPQDGGLDYTSQTRFTGDSRPMVSTSVPWKALPPHNR